MLHYRAAKWHIGDVHPYYENGRLYLFYLVPNGILRCDACFSDPEKVVTKSGAVSFTEDYIHWHEYLLDKAVGNIVKVGDAYYCCRRSGDASFYESRDLVNWQPSRRFRFELDKALFPAGARDYACFWDGDLQAVRVTANAYFTNEHHKMGKGLQCCVLISRPIRADGNSPQRVLLDMENGDRPLMQCKEPECNQMLRIGSRWYLLTSIARQTVHWVGAPSYWIGAESTPIDGQDWQSKQEYKLDGEDLCAAQIAPCNDKFYIFGWIPLNYEGQEWGGDLNLPREVYPLADGRLASRLDRDYAQRIRGEILLYAPQLAASGHCEYRMVIPAPAKDFGIVAHILAKSSRAGVIVDTASGICVMLEGETLSIAAVRDGQILFCFAQMQVDVSASERVLHVLYDGDIVEAFLDDRYALCARVSSAHTGGKAGVFADSAAGITFLEVYTFPAAAACETDFTLPHARI